MWRYGFNNPPNYNDHESYCGGFTRQWQTNGGRCGVCGDPWDEQQVRHLEISTLVYQPAHSMAGLTTISGVGNILYELCFSHEIMREEESLVEEPSPGSTGGTRG